MGEELGTALPGQLLALLAFPICGAIFFAILIAYSLSKRNKEKMKLGIQPRKGSASVQAATTNPEPAPELDTSILSHAASGPKPNLPAVGPEPAKVEPAWPTPANPGLPPEEKVDLAARLDPLAVIH